MLTISDVCKSYGPRTLFEDASLQINRSDRIGLIGPNGAGKSTLFSLILGTEEPDKGSITQEKNVVVGHLPQESAPAGDGSVLELAMATTPEIVELQRKIKAWDSEHPAETDHHENIHARYDQLGGYQLEPKAKRILAGLSFREKDFARPLREMSGGWVMRAHLGRLLTMEPDILMLDEPTNHLDLESLQWFQEYLRVYPGAILMISHDRSFLNELSTHIVEIRQRRLIRYRGNYDSCLEQRAAAEAQLASAYKNQQREIAHMMEFVERFRAKNTKAAQAQSKLKQIERMEKIEAPVNDEKKIHFRFPQPQRGGQKSITLKNIHHSYGANVIYSGVDFQAERGQRIVLVGPNGAGKSTLLKLLASVLKPQSGERELGHNVKSGYYSQYRVDMLNPERTVLEEAMDTPHPITEFVRTVLGCFLFRGDDVFKKVSVLSGGEKSRLALVKLLLDPPNLLLMDEPTTHLDMPSIEALISALEQFAGTLIFISHDVYFIRQLSSHVVRVEGGCLTHYSGGYQYYLDKTAMTFQPAPPPADTSNAAKARTKDQKRAEAEERQVRYRKRKVHQEAVTRLEGEIQRLEARQKELTAELENPASYEKGGAVMQLNREWQENADHLQSLAQEWEKAATRLEEAGV
ncbi:MAG TPA: ABC-F family ATP-binding cassette domain-containing protein [Verrucomicrobiae bacterium]|jgi:ATP-binding cassette subfamily F protein 3|nr:ABC-F family ATP-binding cassette domain-containing protein [Verrucomicrobiae bacterium]